MWRYKPVLPFPSISLSSVPVLPEEDKEEEAREGHGVEVEEKEEDIDWEGD